MASMIGAFFSKGFDSSSIFDSLKIASAENYREHLNQHNVIYINFIKSANMNSSYEDFIKSVEMFIVRDLQKSFPDVDYWNGLSLPDYLGIIHIPNKELMDEFARIIREKEDLGYIYNLAVASDQMLSATLKGDTKKMEEILQYAHDTEALFLDYNNETELTAIVNLVYLSARDNYYVEREDIPEYAGERSGGAFHRKAGQGYVDFIFYPEKQGG